MGNKQGTHESQSKKKRSPGSFKSQFTRHSTYRSYLGHDEVSACALAASRERLYHPEDTTQTSTRERAVDVPAEYNSRDSTLGSTLANLIVDPAEGANFATSYTYTNATLDSTQNTTSQQTRSESTMEESACPSNYSDYCIITRKEAGLGDIKEDSVEDTGSIKRQRNLSSRFKKILSIRKKSDKKERKASAADAYMESKEAPDGFLKVEKKGKPIRRGNSMPGPRDQRNISGIFEDSFWWDNKGTGLDENNNTEKVLDEEEYEESDEEPDDDGPCPSAMDILKWTSWRDNNAIALIDGLRGQRYTFSELEEVTRRAAAGLAKAGVEPGGSVYVVTHNSPEVIITFLATLSLGAVTIMADPNVSHGTVTSQLIAFEPNVVITDMEHVDAATRIALFNSKLKIYTLGTSKKCQSFKRLLEEGADILDEEPFSLQPSDVILHVTCWDVLRNTKRYSTRLTNRNVVRSIEQTMAIGVMKWKAAKIASTTSAHGCCDRCGADVDQAGVARRMRTETVTTCSDVILGVVPFCHPYGLISVAFWSLIQQSTLVTLPHWEMRLVQNVCSANRVTVLPVLSNWTSVMTTHPVVKKAGRLPPEVIIVSNAVFPNWRPVEKLWRCGVRKLTFVYTLAECTGLISAVSITPPTVEKKAGLIPMGSIIKIVDPNGKTLEPEVKGEIYIRGPQVMESTHNQAAAKIGLLERNWLRTGDSGMLTKDGHLMMLGHVNDVIRYQGITVCLRAIEDVMCRHPAVSEACVVAGWALGAHVIRRPGYDDVSTKDILEYTNDFMKPNCQLLYVEFVESLPLTASGRIVRRLVRPRSRNSHRSRQQTGYAPEHQVLI